MKGLLKVTGLRLKRIRKVGTTTVLFTAMMIMLGLFIVFYQLMIYNVNLYIRSNESLYELGELLSHVDYTLRDVCASSIEQHQIIAVLFINYLWPEKTITLPWILAEQKRLDSNLDQVFNNTSYMQYFTSTNEYRLDRLSVSTINLYNESALQKVEAKFALMIEELDVNISESTIDTLDESYDSISHSVMPSSISFIALNRNTRSKYARAIDVMKAVIPVMNDKEPTFSLPANLDANDLKSMAAELMSIVAIYMGDVRLLMHDMMVYFEDKAVDHEPEEYNELFSTLSVAFAVVFLCFAVGLCLLGLYFNKRLFGVMAQYQHLRPEEIQLHREFTTRKLDIFQKYSLDEVKMIEQYTLMESNWSIYRKDDFNAKMKDAILVGGKRSRRTKRLTPDFFFNTFKLLILCAAMQMALVGSYLAVTKYMMNRLDGNVKMIEFYFKFYFRTTEVSDHYMYHNMLANFGDYIKVDGKNVSDKILNMTKQDNDPIVKLNDYLGDIRSQLNTLLGNEASKTAHDLLFKDTCSFIDTARANYKTDVQLCREYLGVNRGFMNFATLQRDTMALIYTTLKSNSDSSTTFPNFIQKSPIFESSYLKFTIVHSLVFNSAVSKMISLQESRIKADLESIKYLNLAVMQVIYITLLVIFCMISFLLNMTVVNRDLAVACESIKNMWPEVVYQNKLVLKVFKESFNSQV